MASALPTLRPSGGPVRVRSTGRGGNGTYEIQVTGGDRHWLGAECPCLPTPATHMGFAGVLHHDGGRGGRGGFFEAQACMDHQPHSPAPGPVGAAANDPCEPKPLAELPPHAFDTRGLIPCLGLTPSNLGGTDG